jgi:hypothetical protein
MCRIQYFEALDSVIGDLDRRFNQKGVALAEVIEKVILTAVNDVLLVVFWFCCSLCFSFH